MGSLPILLPAAALVLLTLIVFWPTVHNLFVGFDDGRYIYENEQVRGGLSREGFIWAFESFGYLSNWHPLTWISHMLDVSLFGLEPGGHHLMSVFLHAAAAVLLFFVLAAMTGASRGSLFVAALFAVHPLHVESVAWAAERKDVLSAFFWTLTIGAYLLYVRRPGAIRYLSTVLCFALGLMTKPTLVTLPLVLLLLDWWPLGRSPFLPRVLLEKVPLLALSALSSVITYLAQAGGGAMSGYPLPVRAGNALSAYAGYIGMTFWPRGLAFFYPHPEQGLSWTHAAASGTFLLVVTAAVFRWARRSPFLLSGWLWYLGTLVPMIGLVQVGTQAMADRYTYIPLTGLFIMAAWGVPLLALRLPRGGAVMAVAAVVLTAALATAARVQVGYWKDSRSLYLRALEVTAGNWVAEYGLGVVLGREGRAADAMERYSRALEIRPDYYEAHNGLGVELARVGSLERAESHFRQALKINPGFVDAHLNLGRALLGQGRFAAAEKEYREVLRLQPDSAEGRVSLGAALLNQGRADEAMEHLDRALRQNPGSGEALYNLGLAWEMKGKPERAIALYREARFLLPDNDMVRERLESLLRRAPGPR